MSTPSESEKILLTPIVWEKEAEVEGISGAISTCTFLIQSPGISVSCTSVCGGISTPTTHSGSSQILLVVKNIIIVNSGKSL